ncbi:uncharacterized protein LOC129614386 [Condylostylus longicornis]|uniref:uncharacterized protein LOC129614386 n=1 Tax=Condylostylus longicornis TaxID=2530218 RepID=UPI00244DEE37|nr:uncharacterized protein LOC129614386 [Condylostylus longicornis]
MNQYKSLFKINGIPILPPLMTAEKYEECRKYKLEASNLEKRRKMDSLSNFSASGCDEQELSDEETETLGGSVQSSLGKSETLIYDVISNTVMIPNEKFNISENKAPKVLKTDAVTLLPHVENEEKYCWNDIPSIIVNSPKHVAQKLCSVNIENEKFEENSNTKSTAQFCDKIPPLIRSDSFTLEVPSLALVNQLLKQDNSLKKNDDLTQQPKIQSKIKKSNERIYLMDNRRKKSPYDSKLIVKSKNLKKHHKNLSLKPKAIIDKKANSPYDETNDLKARYIRKLLDSFEEERKAKLKKLFEKQRNEQEKVEEIFENQEKMLLQLFKNFVNIKDVSL